MSTLWDDVRADFPGLAGKAYLNAAATSLTPRPVREAVTAFYRQLEEGGEAHWDAWLEKREAVRRKVARFVGAQPDEIAFVPNTSTGINLIADLLEADGPVLSDELEFPTVTLPWIHRGVPVRFVAAVEGVLRLESFAEGEAPRTGDDRDQPRAVLERVPPGPRRVRPDQGPAAPGRLRQPVGRGLPGGRRPQPDRRARHRGPQVARARASGRASAT